ncbi:hypothetical protein [Roseibacillus ishigakijimensis]|uniref:Uncharacterized protein n=1 Tax=Roseibacillus ishigakijimensis TaxID=454146 RepID=A0A934VLK7_9BACT|nr:hypothetical protein [Roseibacillus ishigakijimensis]MBK1834784.1 hypothetical protein [Roseibacillus ishigakijimensis]
MKSLNEMKRNVLSVFGILLSFGLGWILKPNGEQVVEVTPRKSEHMRSQSAARSTAQSDPERWLSRFDGREVAEVAQELSDDELVHALEALLVDMWGGTGYEQAKRFQTVVGEWIQRDKEGCIAWARGQEDEKWREAALLAVIDQLGQSDPLRAIHLYCEIDRVTLAALAGFDAEYWQEAMAKVAEDSPADLAEILNNLPLRPSFEEDGWDAGLLATLRLPEGFDFEELFRLAPEADRVDSAEHHLHVYLLQDWARQDPQAALDHVVARLAQGEMMRWGLVLNEFEKEVGQSETMNLALQVLEQIPQEHQKGVLEASWRWKEMLDALPTEEQRLHYLLLLDPEDDHTDPFRFTRWREYAAHIGLKDEDGEVLGAKLRARAAETGRQP